MTAIDIKNRIHSYIEDITGAGYFIQKSYNYFEPMPDAFPCAMVYQTDMRETRLDFRNNEVTEEYTIKVCIPLDKGSNRHLSENLRIRCVEAVTDRLRVEDAFETLGGLVYACIVTGSDVYVDATAEFPMMITDIKVQTRRTREMGTLFNSYIDEQTQKYIDELNKNYVTPFNK
jgi:hypothetical protein